MEIEMNAKRIGTAARHTALIAMMLAAGASYAAEVLPSNSPASSNSAGVSNSPTMAAVGKTRAQVRAELDQSVRAGETVVGFTALSARELDPDRFARSEPNFAGVNAAR
jgi:hypothetical protein